MLRKSVVLLSSCLAAAVCVPAGASAATVSSSGTIHAGLADTTGGKLRIGGPIKDSKYGSGAILFYVKSATGTVKTTFTAFLPTGSISGTTTDISTSTPDGGTTLTNGKITVTKGTGAYKGFKGTGTFKGTSTKALLYSLTYTLKLTH